MIKSKHHIVIYPLFKRLTQYLLKRKFKSIDIQGEYNDTGKPVLVIANHIGWWDGFWLMHLNLKILHRKFHFMMLEEQLKKHWYFQYTGAFSVKKHSRSVVESINYTTELLNDSKNMVFMFPQGEINSLYNNVMHFEKGIQRIIEHCHDEVQVIFVANLIDYFSNSKPSLYIYMQTDSSQNLKDKSIEKEYNKFYNNILDIQKTKTS
ncbi:MAG: lysophospholipid acyltransferase family protein [Bacteroidales bacterium]|nr:lysophospholipid acyltransferase family protein [Bacteroidales bacterium]MDY0216359.1 lysophospholipid acyltransferase family protein [Bacteroidales bacterium]